ncbi:SDR family NAD(P)-dependent oxidoreductase [Agromyces soli]|uniref:SDR family oxidoreductase n=1 Tax=Agromyces soli TaxID=659012 RepID=A0ABY4AVF5_9MICO|nr:SDR family NAD(P)-dependent oxidoreductase [Agromyces soli]UOE27160.1 SDR family oxidoreductase [Agromyces soli]
MTDIGIVGMRVLITGGASGIGRAAAFAAGRAGARLVIADRDPLALERTTAELRAEGATATAVELDVSDESSVAAAFETVDRELGGLDGVLHVAGIMREQGASLTDISAAAWRQVIEINLTGSFLVARASAERFVPNRAGVLVLVGSGAGVVAPSGSLPYGASKGGVNGFAMTLEHQLTPYGIRVHNFCPGSVDTPLYRNSLQERVTNGASQESVDAIIAGATDVATVGEALALLLSPLAGALKGNVYTR